MKIKELSMLEELVSYLKDTNSSNEKKRILAEYPECKPLLYYVLNPFINFYITSNNLKKNSNLVDEWQDYPNVYEFLDDLSERVITGHKAISVANRFIRDYSEHEDILYAIIDKDLETRVDAKLANKVWPGFIPEFEVALAKKYEDYEAKINFEETSWLASRKLDGIRLITVIDEYGNIEFLSRQGKEFFTLDNLRQSIKELNLKETVFDGEVCIVDENGDENFTSIMREIRKKNHTIEFPRYKIFDMLTLEEFRNKYSVFPLSQRYNLLDDTVKDNDYLNVVEQWEIENKEHLMAMMKDAVDSGWEGLIVRKDCPYEGKRTNDMLKVKKFFDAEYEVKDVVMDEIRFFDDGVECKEEMLSSIVIEHKGYRVNVGSGFSIGQRREFYNDSSRIIGKQVTIVYFEETTNKSGTVSLRFPTVKFIHGDKREV